MNPLRGRDFALVALAKAGLSAIVLASGFSAVSDDDYARITIAQRFVAEPSLDPTGTSWLPFPFWLYGGVMTALGRDVEVARATAFVLGVLAALAVLVAARWVGASRSGAIIGAIAASTFPYAAWLGVATVPDFPTAALIVVGLSAATRDDGRARAWGALALFAATLSRYEAWPVAAGFAVLSFLDARHKRALALPGGIAIAGPLGWMLHGITSHGDALFFVKRVSAYKRAVGGEASFWSALVDQPLAVLRCEPELACVTLVVVGTAVSTGHTKSLRRHLRPLALLGLLLAFLVAGELRGSGATHHAERAVLAIWIWMAVLAADVAVELWPELGARTRTVASAAVFGLALVGGLVLRPWYARRDDFIDRSREVALGQTAASLARNGDVLVVDTPDFGFYAVIAGFQRPEHARPLDDRDPRRPAPTDPFGSKETLRAALDGARWLVTRAQRLPLVEPAGSVRHRDERYGLVELDPNR